MKNYLMLMAALTATITMSCSSSDSSTGDEPPVVPPTSGGVTDVTDKISVTVENEYLKVTQDLSRGGAIGYIAKTGTTRSIVNVFDDGRYIQQSYYAGDNVDRRDEGQGSSWSPWPWNPIQVGDYKRNRAQILSATLDGNKTYVKCVPMLWDMDNKPAEAVMEQWTELDGKTIHVKCRLTCNRTDEIYGEGKVRDQELPAVYPISSLNNLYTYKGQAPFTGGDVEQLEVVQLTDNPNGGGGIWGRYNNVTEQWMAFVDDSGWGLGVYSPSATKFAAGRSDSNTNGTATSASTSYIAPLCTAALMKNSVMEYEYHLVIDNLEGIRTSIYNIHSNL